MGRLILRGAGLALVVLALWQGVVWATGVPAFILPGPARVARALATHAGMLADHARFTLANLGMGLAAGLALGVVTALNLALSPVARAVMRPMLVLAQAVPVFALAPIVTLWLGYGAPSKVVMVALVTYFPLTSVLFDALMRPPPALADLALSMRATPWRRLWLIQLPHALPALGSGLRLAAVYAPFAVIVGEWVGSSRGLGYLMLMANGRGQTDLMFAALVLLAAMGLALFALAGLVDRLVEGGRPQGAARRVTTR
ncbi:ABC transporter permease [Paracoccus aestuarii]|uniref:ABC transporter permease n=1 Tax=Paracoccus aestuarii TaxID=453842 RepID=A0A418ZRJ0_9RHOB|nr:ABC transporter permease [Paracoccus aestuarii]RJK98567.1 ABC transporter permease [Paracoccus aestuarii]WCR00385.1 ABC transporter permease [Paracoccus aestuarii]